MERKQAVKRSQFFSTVSWNGSMFLRKHWNASVPQPPSQMHLCILDSTTTRTHSTDVTIHSYHQLMILYRKHYDRLSFYVIVIKVSFFFFIGQVNRFLFLLYFYYFHHESDGSKEKNTIGVQEA